MSGIRRSSFRSDMASGGVVGRRTVGKMCEILEYKLLHFPALFCISRSFRFNFKNLPAYLPIYVTSLHIVHQRRWLSLESWIFLSRLWLMCSLKWGWKMLGQPERYVG